MMLKNAVKDRDQDHQKGKDTTEVGHDLYKVHLSIMVKNAVKSQDQDYQKGKDTIEVGHDLCKVLLTIILKNTTNSNKNSSLIRGLSRCTILNSDKCRPELTHHVQLNSTQEKSLFNIASVRGRSQSPKCPNDKQKCEASPMCNQILHSRIHSAEVGHDLRKVIGILHPY